MKTQELIRKGLLIKSHSSQQEIDGSLAIAQHFIARAKGNQKIEYFDIAFSLAYQSMFHAARALLFKNGLKERSHFGLIQALGELYSENPELRKMLGILDSYRISRHAIQYTGAACSEVDAKEAIQTAEELVKLVQTVIAQKAP